MRAYLALTVDARIVVAIHTYRMSSQRTDTERLIQSIIQSLGDRPVEAAELLNVVIERSDAVYVCFLDVSKDMNNSISAKDWRLYM